MAYRSIWRYTAVYGVIPRYMALYRGIWRYTAVCGGIRRHTAMCGNVRRIRAAYCHSSVVLPFPERPQRTRHRRLPTSRHSFPQKPRVSSTFPSSAFRRADEGPRHEVSTGESTPLFPCNGLVIQVKTKPIRLAIIRERVRAKCLIDFIRVCFLMGSWQKGVCS